jgi:nitroreductase
MKSTESLIHKAVRAPSSHNTQPWLFHVSESTISLYADRTRALPVNDPDDRELTISCGCALMNLRVAAAAEGLDVRIEALPVSDEPDLLARFHSLRRRERLSQKPHSRRSSNSVALTESASCPAKWTPKL